MLAEGWRAACYLWRFRGKSIDMNPLLRVALWGLGISALGTLPLGALNIAAMQVSMAEGVRNAALFSLGVALVEMAYLRISIIGINWIRHHATLLRYMDWLAFLVVAALAVSSFIAASDPSGETKNVILNAKVNSFVLGMGMSAVNPMQVPFWFGWSTILFSKGVLHAKRPHYNSFTTGAGIGTIIGLAVFVLGGQFIVQRMNDNQQVINYIIASIFAITALVFLYKIVFNKGAAAALEKKGVHVDDEH
jgi:threonine/homoserine/homoserine lactone efflux protein